MKVSKSTLVSKKYGTTQTLPGGGRPTKLRKKDIGQGGDQEPNNYSNKTTKFLG